MMGLQQWATALSAVLVTASGCRDAGSEHVGFQPVRIDHPRYGHRAYTVFVPPPRSAGTFPLIVFLHGSDEVGWDGWKHLKVGLGPYCQRSLSADLGPRFYALFPQAREVADWSPGSDEATLVLEQVASVCDRYPIDRSRIYLTGHSAGGAGVWDLAAARPDLWAALVVVSGRGTPEQSANIRHLPVWVFHGAFDDPDSVRNAREMVAALRAVGGRPKYTEFPTGTHIIWPEVYSRPDLYDWLLTQRRGTGPIIP